MDSFHNRMTSIDRASVESILTGADQPTEVPSPHIGASPNRVNFSVKEPPRPIVRPDRALSYTSRRPNRLSLTFPVAPSSGPESARVTPTSSNTPSVPATPADPNVIVSPNDPNGFLVALASQERRVLELKEELSKAETELKQLKTQWALHEATKKRAEIRHVEKLQPVQTERGSPDENVLTTPKQSIDMDRKKAFLANLPHLPKDQKNPRRKIITGGHTRTLSLLSPERMTRNSTVNEVNGTTSVDLPRSTTMPDTSIGISRVNTNRANRNSYQGGLGVTHGVKQITEDVKTGLWNFLEDLRQATVGEEAVNGKASKRSSLDATQRGLNKRISKGSLRGRRGKSPRPDPSSQRTWDSLTGSNPALLDLGGALWQDPNSLAAPLKPTNVQKKSARPISFPTATIDDDDWSNWDSPTPKSPMRWSGSSTLSGPVTPGNTSSEDEVNILDQHHPLESPSRTDEIQWPALDNLKPGNLKKTISTAMKEWEKSLTPPPEETHSGDFLTGSPRVNGRREREPGVVAHDAQS
ncbi:hypothetical protein SS1G_07710 [Sclerotinia sclerotiorum 1980 UF-70]|uniref:DUF4048 domain-containing protein n=2 Tax=Sclerotinia sclerotiorum (strain ATCC 18683 / 1980 / Ss-1) TaxID=665079 RepID=A7EQV7_SCLS1|nr:hypothetical protein SS1G_07710 [Sclerotinia sclerotiorum 1980 UF-70]APA13630.1 hypothetical protein sscle_11g084000 [Sclerotinia sclerotiorum 1980 UF-70]EDN91849.1 hypothetical protein SS1G_07710 [Sclerotinia sclerotiorum 1980 UF-70]